MHEAAKRERFRALYETSYPRILGYALRRTRTPEDAADVVSETFLAAWRRFDDMPPGEESLLWLYGVAHRVLANQRRGQRRRNALSDRLAAELGALALARRDPLPSDLAPLAEAWRRLRPEDRELLALVAWEGLGNEQLAAVLGCTRTAVKLRLHRARRRFAARLDEAGVALDPPTAAPARAAHGRLGALDPLRPPAAAESLRPAAARSERKPRAAAGHVISGRASARPGTEEA